MTEFLAGLPAITTAITAIATGFGNVLLTPPYSIFLSLAVIGIGFSWFRSFIGSRD